MIRDERLYHEALAKELGGVLTGYGVARGAGGRGIGKDLLVFMKDERGRRGMLSLDEVWCIWNRARGVGTFWSPGLMSDGNMS